MNCKKCKKAGAYIRTRTNDVLCRQCGHVEKLETKKEFRRVNHGFLYPTRNHAETRFHARPMEMVISMKIQKRHAQEQWLLVFFHPRK